MEDQIEELIAERESALAQWQSATHELERVIKERDELREELDTANEELIEAEEACAYLMVLNDNLSDRLKSAENARVDTLDENRKLNDAIGKVHIICGDAGIDPGHVVDRVHRLADKLKAADRYGYVLMMAIIQSSRIPKNFDEEELAAFDYFKAALREGKV